LKAVSEIKYPSSGIDIKRAIKNNTGVVAVYGAVLIIFLSAGIMEADVFKSQNILTILHHMTALGLTAIGETFCLLAGTFDLSVGSVISLTSLLFSGTVNGRPEMVLYGTVLVLAVGLLIGLINGILIAKAKINPFITTLAMLLIAQGAALLYHTGPYGKITPFVQAIGYGTVGFVPLPVIITTVFFIVAWIILTKTQFGMHVYALGGGGEPSRLSGIAVDKIRIGTHVICSLMAAITGIYFSARMGTGDPYSGMGYELEAIAAVCIAGTSLFGGRGTIWGTLGGVMLMSTLANAFNQLNLETMAQLIIRGVIIIIAVAVYTARDKNFGS
jgi:ribose transport system permease protein